MALQKITGTHNEDKVFLLVATVESVDEPSRSCKVMALSGHGQLEIENVQLMCGIDDGMLLIPTIGSTVIVGYSTFNQAYVALFSELDKVLVIVGESAVSITDGKIQFNDGQLGGMVKIIELTKKLNNLENLLNDLIAKYNAHTHVLTLSSGSGTAAATVSTETQSLTPTERTEIENDKITHG